MEISQWNVRLENYKYYETNGTMPVKISLPTPSQIPKQEQKSLPPESSILSSILPLLTWAQGRSTRK